MPRCITLHRQWGLVSMRRRGAFHTGALTTCCVRHKLPDGSGQAVVGATADGAVFAAALLLDGQTAQVSNASACALCDRCACHIPHAGKGPLAAVHPDQRASD